LQHVQQLKQSGEIVYPHKYDVSISLRDFIDKYSYLKNDEINEDIVSVAGNIYLSQCKYIIFFYLK
jgi:lysyl-tRNA synthetase class II